MRLILILILTLCARSSFACPDLSGSYIRSDLGDVIFRITQTTCVASTIEVLDQYGTKIGRDREDFYDGLIRDSAWLPGEKSWFMWVGDVLHSNFIYQWQQSAPFVYTYSTTRVLANGDLLESQTEFQPEGEKVKNIVWQKLK